MPVIPVFFGIVIRMFYREHGVGHFHAEYQGQQATFTIHGRGKYRIHLRFHDGVEKTGDFAQWLEGPIFEPLKDLGYFQRFLLDGGTVSWPNGAGMAPETLYEEAKSNEAA